MKITIINGRNKLIKPFVVPASRNTLRGKNDEKEKNARKWKRVLILKEMGGWKWELNVEWRRKEEEKKPKKL